MLGKEIQNILFSLLSEMHTATIGQIESFDPITRLASIQPCLKRKFTSGEIIDLPLLEDVPVLFFGSGDFEITFELKNGSYVLLIIAERAIENWITKGGLVDPELKRTFDLSDAIAIPGLTPLVDTKAPIETDCISIRKIDNTSYLKLSVDGFEILGDIKVTGNINVTGTIEATELQTLLGIIATHFSSHTHPYESPTGPDATGPPTPGS